MSQKYTSGFRKLIAWQKAHEITLDIYRFTRSFPKDELYGITSQLRRASSSIAAQITEGSRMTTMNHRKSYYDRAYASAAEVDYFLELAHDLEFLPAEKYEEFAKKINYVSALVLGLAQSCKNKQ
jgi:four helix bundle protein